MSVLTRSLVPCLVSLPLAASGTNPPDNPKFQVEVVYDDYAIPHVFGGSDAAAFYGLGYQHAIDYPIGTLNMLWLYSGRMAEIAGPRYIDEDRLIRLWDVPAIAARHAQELDAQGLLANVEAYVAGVEAGRAFWRDGGAPEDSARIDALFGPTGEIRIDPVPDYLNPTFSPFGGGAPLATQMRNVVDRLFDESLPVTTDHVLHLGAVIQSFFLYRGNPLPGDKLPPINGFTPAPAAPEDAEAASPDASPGEPNSNGWVISAAASLVGRPLVLSDTHLLLNRVQLRPYLAQVVGSSFSATGLTMAGYPGMINAFNNELAWTVTASPAAVTHNTWSVDLLPSLDPEDLAFDLVTPTGTERVELEKVQETLSWFDPVSKTVNPFNDTRYYVPVHPSEANGAGAAGLGFSRYPVIPQSSAAPLPGTTIRFEQASFSVQRNFFEWTMRMGKADDTAAVRSLLSEVGAPFGDGNNLLVIDRESVALHAVMATVPVQGAGVDPADYDEDAILDGGRLDQRWQGIHAPDFMPIIGPADLSDSPEVWINNNVTPDLVETTRFTAADLASFPEYAVPHETITSWRQERADELLRQVPYPLLPIYSELVARDMTDQWTLSMWPFFEAAAGLAPGGLSPNAQLFLQWVDEYRHEDEFGNSNPLYDFVAHRYSRVTVYTVLLRSIYLQILGSQNVTGLPASFGYDPVHPLFDAPEDFTYASYAANVEAMRGAIEGTTQLWLLGSGPNGLRNQAQLAGLSPLIPGDPYADARYSTDRDPQWLGIPAGNKVTRWGHVKALALTPHAPLIPGVSDLNNSVVLNQAFVFAMLQPSFLAALPLAFLKVDFYLAQTPRIYPMGGTELSMYLTLNPLALDDLPPTGYTESLYRISPSSFFFWHPHYQASQTMFSVQLNPKKSPNAAPWPLFLQAIASTEITKSDVLGDGQLAYQDRFATAEDFSRGLWRFLVTSRSYLGDPTYELTYTP